MAQWLNLVSEAEGEPVPPTTPIFLSVGGVLIIWVGTLSSLAPILFPIWPLPPSPSPSVHPSRPRQSSALFPFLFLFRCQIANFFLHNSSPPFFSRRPLVRETEHVISTLISGLPTSHGFCSVRATDGGTDGSHTQRRRAATLKWEGGPFHLNFLSLGFFLPGCLLLLAEMPSFLPHLLLSLLSPPLEIWVAAKNRLGRSCYQYNAENPLLHFHWNRNTSIKFSNFS